MPETKPDLKIDALGVCSACRYLETRKTVDWDARMKKLLAIVDKYRAKNATNWDCIVPVSGGKDSTFQVIKMLELGLNPLCVTAATCKLSEIGRRNLANLKRLGVDSLEVTTNPVIRRRINRLTLRQIGDISWPEHVTIFTIPVRIAVQLGIPLIIWGENSQNEYGGPAAEAESNVLTRRWLEEFGGMMGLRVTDILGQDGIEAKHLISYTYPSDADLTRVGVTGLFLGHYIPWDGYTNVLIAQGHGFESWQTTIEGSIVNYENLDNVHTGIHDYFKYIKYGYGRATDLACLHLRRGRLTRGDAIQLVRRHDGVYPWSYLDVSLQEQLEELDIPMEEFDQICERFTNKRLFVCDARGNLVRDARKNLTKINYDNEPVEQFASR
jgi:N-acetyl sugar amidotransferase